MIGIVSQVESHLLTDFRTVVMVLSGSWEQGITQSRCNGSKTHSMESDRPGRNLRFDVPSGLTAAKYLRKLAGDGMKRRFGGNSESFGTRLEAELVVIERMNFCDQYLIAWDITRWAREQGIMVGPGRGAVGGSLVAYCLGISNLDPIRLDLLFERFLSPARTKPPEMSIDVQDDRFTQVIGYVVTRYGQDGAQSASPYHDYLSPRALVGSLGLELCGSAPLRTISWACQLVRQACGPELAMDRITDGDEETYQLISRGDTEGVYHLESEGMRDLLRELKPSRLEDLVAILALYRPGPMNLIPDFIAKKNGEVPVSYDHALLEPILKATYGITVYQEQVMRIGKEVAGFDVEQVEKLRKAMGKKDPDAIETLKKPFVEAALKKGVSAEQAEKIFDDVHRLAGHAFNKSHAAACATLAYQTAYLKAHYPDEYMSVYLCH